MKRLGIILFILSLWASGARAYDDNQKDWGHDYASGSQLENQNRLSEPYDNFDVAHQKKENGEKADAYLLQLREQMAAQAKKEAQERLSLSFAQNNPESAITIAYPEKDHMVVTVRVNSLFLENSATLQPNSLDVVYRLAGLIQKAASERVELSLIDNIDESPAAKDLDAERSLALFGILNFKRVDNHAS